MAVVVIEKHGQRPFELPCVENEQPVETLGPGSDEPFRDPNSLRHLNANQKAYRGTASLACWAELMRLQDLPDRGRRDDDAESLQFGDDALITPARVLACQPDDRGPDLTTDRRPPGTSRVSPPLRHYAAVPAQQSRRRNQKRRPPDPWQKSARRRQEQAIGRSERGPLDLPAQHLPAYDRDVNRTATLHRRVFVRSENQSPAAA